MDSNIEKVILVVGAGQLGSRHLQGILKVEGKLLVFVLDTSADSLNVAKERAKEVQHNHAIQFVQDWALLPERFDLVIVATGASVRKDVMDTLLDKFYISCLVVEKVLFQELSAYSYIEKKIKEKGVSVWVNHPRRMMPGYDQLRNEICADGGAVQFNLVGGNWGLGCNALHFIDLLSFLTNSAVESIDMEWLDDIVYESKRINHVEFTGTVKGRTTNNSCFTISSLAGDAKPITISISTSFSRWFIQEGATSQVSCLRYSTDNSFTKTDSNFQMEFQSSLTTRLVNDLLKSGNCDLPTYDEACQSHVPFITALLKKYNEITGSITTICPIT